jgi:Glycosyltransferase family 92
MITHSVLVYIVSYYRRYGPYTEWIASFDTDEYFVPMGNYTNLKDVLSDAHRGGTNILSFRSSRGKLRREKSDEVNNGSAIQKSPSALFLDAYNCDGAGSPKPSWADRARKQIYRTDYVVHHFVHYSTATKGLLTSYKEHQEQGTRWIKKYQEKPPMEIFSDESTQAVMVHTKSVMAALTQNFKKNCRYDSPKRLINCWVANPWPNNEPSEENTYDDSGLKYNCFINPKVEDYWMPKLQDALAKRINQSHIPHKRS